MLTEIIGFLFIKNEHILTDNLYDFCLLNMSRYIGVAKLIVGRYNQCIYHKIILLFQMYIRSVY